MMLQAVIFDTIVRLWWEPTEAEYAVYLNGEEAQKVAKTHAKLTELTPDTDYEVRVVDGAGVEIGSLSLHTAAQKRRIDVTKAPYFAVGDGKTVNTAALQRALDDCGEGEAVYLPEGVFMTGSLRMHGGTELYVDTNAVLQGTDDPDDYTPKIPSRFEGLHMECYAALINIGHIDSKSGPNCGNVVLRGGGRIFGGGRALADRVIERERVLMADYIASLGDKVKECENDRTIPGRKRPRLINVSNGENVVIADLGVGYGACWNVHMIYSRGVVTCGCTFHSENVWNGDGWDPDSSEDCVIFDCDFYTGDDSVAIKSGKNPEGNIVARPSRGIRVFDCRCKRGHGITVGSEMSGGVEDVFVWDCELSGSNFGMEIKGTKKRGGYVRDIRVKNCRMPRIMMHSVRYNDDGEGSPTAPIFENCLFEDVCLTGRAHMNNGDVVDCNVLDLHGFEEEGHEIKNVTLRNVTLESSLDAPARMAFALCEGLNVEGLRAKAREE